MDDPTIGLVTSPSKKNRKNGADEKAPKPSLVQAGEDHEKGRPKVTQSRVDGDADMTEAEAWEQFKEASADHEVKKQRWADAQKAREVRLDDLVKVHAHKPFDSSAAARVSKEAAKSVQREKDTLEEKQKANKAVGAARDVLRQYLGEEKARSLIPDDEADA